MKFDHRLLHRMQRPVRPAQMLDGDHMATIERGQKANTGIDRLIPQHAAGEPPDQHGAGAAIALGAAFLGAGQSPVEAQEIEQGLRGRDIGQRHRRPVEQKTDLVAAVHLVPPEACNGLEAGLRLLSFNEYAFSRQILYTDR